MSTFRVHLGDRVLSSNPSNWGEGTAYAIGNNIKNLYDQVCQDPNTTFSDSDFFWNSSPGSIQSNEVLIYFVNTKGDSLITQVWPGSQLGVSGTTKWNTSSGCISEIYVSECISQMGDCDVALGLALMAFHESMHNKVRMGDSLHNQSGVSLGRRVISFCGQALSAGDIALMAPALDRDTAQYTSFLNGLPQSTADVY